MESKSELRKEIIELRDSLDSNLWTENSNAIQRNVLRSKIYSDADCLLCYSDFHGEVGTLTIIEDALLNGKRVFLPKVLENFDEARMDFYEIHSTVELINGYKGIFEPTGNKDRVFNYSDFSDKNVLMLIPGVVFSSDYKRIGYGKGYYDNYLKDKANILKIGLCFSLQIKDTIPTDEHDVSLDYIISENTSFEELDKISYRG